MKALVFQGPWEMTVEDRAPRDPSDYEVRVAVIATGICGSDIHGFAGHTGRRHPNQVMGHETVGRIDLLGSQVSGLKVGDLVSINPAMTCGECSNCKKNDHELCDRLRVLGVVPEIDAAFAEFVTVPSENIIPLDPNMNPVHGALIEPLAVGYHALRRGHVSADQNVVVIGGGPIGQAVAIACRRIGVNNVIVSEISPTRSALLMRLGFTVVHPKDLLTEVESLFGRKADTVIDAVGSEATIASSHEVSKRGSTIVFLGMAEPVMSIKSYEFSVAERTLVGSFCYNKDDFSSTAKWIAENPEIGDALIDQISSPEEAPGIFTALARQELDVSKVLVRFS